MEKGKRGFMINLSGLQVLNALAYLRDFSSKQSPWTAEALSTSVRAPHTVMQNSLSKLARAGIVSAVRGPRGGFFLEEIQGLSFSVVDVLRVLGQDIKECGSLRASDKAQTAVYDALNVPIWEFLE